LLPLAEDSLRRLGFLGLRTLGQYAALPPAAVWQQFGRAGKLAHRYARGQDNRPVIPRWQAPSLATERAFEIPLVERERVLIALRQMITPLLAELRGNLQACAELRLMMHFDDGSSQERTRSFLFPTAEEPLILRALEQLLDKISWPAVVTSVSIALERIQDAVIEQLTLFPAKDERKRQLRQVQRYLAARFGTSRLRRAALVQPGAPLPEWRFGWQDGEEL
jgi:hypothetical protein